jgi:hypothetical protein
MSKVLFKKNLARNVTLGKTTEITYNFHKTKNGKNADLEIEDIRKIYESAEAEIAGVKNVQSVVRVLGKTQQYTVKEYTGHELKLKKYEEYIDGRVKDVDKFNKFFQMQITFKIVKK